VDIPAGGDADELYAAFEQWAAGRGLTLYPAQSEAVIELVSGNNVVLSTPTGSGKSLVAIGAHAAALSRGEQSWYTAPLKALVSEKFFALVEVFGAENVGLATGDASVNSDAPIICCTAEVLANKALREGAGSSARQVVMDEFHFYADPARGWAWQVPLLELPQAQFLLMSATLGDVSRFEDQLTRRTGRPTAVVTSVERPVPLFPSYVLTPIHETIADLLAGGQAPVYVVHPSQAAAIEQAQALMSVNMCTRAEKDAIAEQIGHFRFTTGFGRTLSRLVRHGVGVHHAGMLPKYRRLVEVLAQAGLLKVICGTDTLGVGINVPIRTVVFSALSKYDGSKVRHLKAREFAQVAGRAGRAGFDTAGGVVAQAPEHEIENARRVAKAGDDPKKLKRVERKKAPEGFVSWGKPTFERLWSAEPEALTSHFDVSHAMLLNVAQRPGDFFAHMRHLLEANDEPRPRQLKLIRKAIGLYRALVAGGVLERLSQPDDEGRTVRVTVDLQLDFALNQPLATFALAAFELLDRDAPTYALDVLSVLEATLDDPRQVLAAQRNKVRGELVAELKAQGMEYEERMAVLEEVSYPQPLAELLEAGYDAYRRGHPWVLDHHLSPKSVARDLSERAMTFVEYVGYYQLARSEGLLLRYLADAYKALRQTVPEAQRTEELTDLTEWLGELVRQVDSSLLDEWEQLREPSEEEGVVAVETVPRPVTGNARAFRVLVRNAVFRRVELLALRRLDVLQELDPGVDWLAQLEAYYAEHQLIETGPDARGPHRFQVSPGAQAWQVRQVVQDPAGNDDWAVEAEVDLAASDAEGVAVLRVSGLVRLDG
jgi:superfamily II RNA helicase